MSSVTFHKSGRFVRIKANDVYSADVIREIEERRHVPLMLTTSFYSAGEKTSIPKEEKKIEIWRWLEKGIEIHPIIQILTSYGITVTVSESLKNYMKKEWNRQKLENTPYPTPPITTDISLFDRCSEGSALICIKDHGKTSSGTSIFHKGLRYMVVKAGGDGKDSVILSTNDLASTDNINLVGNAAKHEWTIFDEPMETYFSDSESTDLGPNLVKKYPAQVKASKKKLANMKLALYDHVAEDAAMMALKRGVLNAYPMRMAKTSCAIAVAELSGSQKVAAVSPGNARLFWTKEFKRLGFKEGEDFVEVRSLDQLSSPAKYHLMVYTWLSLGKDVAYTQRKKGIGFLKSSVRVEKRRVQGITWKETEEIEIDVTNDCPHCGKAMERPIKFLSGLISLNIDGKVNWTTKRGYVCRNSKCTWRTDNIKINTAWEAKKLVTHKGGYVDYELARHANCDDVKVKGRMCPECHTVDSMWTPPRYKRIKKKYTHVILDESHATKDRTTNTATAALNLRARRRQTLTGTPMSNSAMDVYWPMQWAVNGPSTGFPYFGTDGEKEFDKKFCDAVFLEKPIGTETNAQGQVTQITKTVRKRVPFLKNPPDFWKFMSGKMIRRAYTDPLFVKTLTANGRFMPKLEIKKISCPMDPIQAALMLASIKDFKGTFNKLQKEAQKKGTQINPTLVISQMTTMRTTATCPELLNDKYGKKIYTGPAGGGKIPYIRGIVDEKVEAGGKVLILSDFRKMQETVEKALDHHNLIRFNTSWDDDTRREAFDKFQDDKNAKVFIAGTRAVRESVDLSAADTVICCDLLWSPAFQTQAWSRILAPSTRDRVCEAYLVLSSNSLDEHIFNVFYSKLVAAEQAIDRKILNRRAQDVDIQWFVERVIEEETAISYYLRDAGEDTMIIADLDLSALEERDV